ncbi:MAG: ERF family protein [Streptococcus infantarius]|nr:ERF family protein [Streptococcus infantarius]
MENLTFPELQQRMQLAKKKTQDVKYAFRNAEDIYTAFKELKTDWYVIVKYDLTEVAGRLFVKATAKAAKDGEQHQTTAYAELSSVPVFNTKKGQIKQMQDPQWTGAVSSYAGKYALQGLFAIGEKDVDEYQVQDEQQTTQNHQTQNNQSQQTQYINDAQIQQIYNGINKLAQMTNQNPDIVASGILVNYNIKDFHEVPSEFFNEVVNYIKSLIPQQNQTNFNDL